MRKILLVSGNSITHLDFAYKHNYNSIFKPTQEALNENVLTSIILFCPNLQCIDLTATDAPYNAIIMLLDNCPKIKKLSLNLRLYHNDAEVYLSELLTRSKDLTYLKLMNFSDRFTKCFLNMRTDMMKEFILYNFNHRSSSSSLKVIFTFADQTIMY